MADADRAAWRRHLGEDVEPAALRERLTAGTLSGCFAATAAERGDAPALEVDGAAASHGELDDRAARVAGFLRERGVARGDRVLLCAPTSLELVVAYLGTLRAGATAMPCDAALTADELAPPARRRAAGGGVRGPGRARAARARRARGDRRGDRRAGRRPPRAGGRAGGAPDRARARPGAGDAGLHLRHHRPAQGRPAHATPTCWPRSAARCWRGAGPPMTSSSMPCRCRTSTASAASTSRCWPARAPSSPRRFEPAALCDAIAARRATVLFAVPAMYERLDAWEGIAEADFSSLRLAVSGSAPLSPALAERIAARLGQVPLERYGSTEAGLDVSNLYDGPRRPGRVGWALPGIELRLADDGEILLRGPQVFGGYWERPDATAEALSDDGWFRTGDLGRLDARGRQPGDHRPQQGADHQRRAQRLPARGGGRAGGAPRRRARRRGRRAVRALGRGGRGVRRRRRRRSTPRR